MPRIFTIIAAFLVLAAPLHAQKKRKIEARTLCYARSAEASKLQTFGGKSNKAIDILLPKNNFSEPFACSLADNVATFFIKGVDSSGKEKPQIVAQAKVPASTKKALFYFTPNKAGSKLKYNVRVLPDDLKAFPLGHTRVLNLNSTDARFILGEHKCQLKPGQLKTLPSVTKKSQFNMASIKYQQLNSKNKWRTIRDRTTKCTDKKRTLIIAYYDSHSKRPNLRIYKDFPKRSN